MGKKIHLRTEDKDYQLSGKLTFNTAHIKRESNEEEQIGLEKKLSSSHNRKVVKQKSLLK